jgi:hypothetical protein
MVSIRVERHPRVCELDAEDTTNSATPPDEKTGARSLTGQRMTIKRGHRRVAGYEQLAESIFTDDT